ncbi:MAG: molybdate transport system ATP-binding protein [Actinomycetota bacterium]|nr:molybdate transport system ATP-binding protein [Actinomycetota bacterium]
MTGTVTEPATVVGRPSGVDAAMHVRRASFELDLRLSVAAGETVALLGPNGAGKTTALRAMAGLVRLEQGHLLLDGVVLEDCAVGVRLPPERRAVGVVFQDYLLFPHLSARENVAFPLRARGMDKATARRRADEWLSRVGLADRVSARPRELSGGQAQRVALARALVSEPALLLLDEPLAALDAGTRIEIRSHLRRHLSDFAGAAVLVTHDALDAMVLADRLVVLEGGRVVQVGAPADVARHPRTDYVARLVGLNLFRGRAEQRSVSLVGGGSLTVAQAVDGDVFVAFSPAAVALHPQRPTGSPRNAWQERVTSLEQHGDSVRVVLDGPLRLLADVTAVAVAELGLTVGAPVWAAVKATETRVYPA